MEGMSEAEKEFQVNCDESFFCPSWEWEMHCWGWYRPRELWACQEGTGKSTFLMESQSLPIPPDVPSLYLMVPGVF